MLSNMCQYLADYDIKWQWWWIYSATTQTVYQRLPLNTVNCGKWINIILNKQHETQNLPPVLKPCWISLVVIGKPCDKTTEIYLAKLNSQKKRISTPQSIIFLIPNALLNVVELQWTMYVGRNASTAKKVTK